MKFIAANTEEAAAAAGKQKAHMAQTADGSAVRSKWQQSSIMAAAACSTAIFSLLHTAFSYFNGRGPGPASEPSESFKFEVALYYVVC